ncbi:DNA topology modulation protein [Macrococcus equipercicus]|uniref:DNA topology modulation protein n=1 Tax=Macrococcus equipercicus TaxID=69967 RepID=A0ABQ6R6H8_9STAP|nr:DNA topology modulation protein [Macrococcus equipercicus]KAA1036899.1 DNA topology modulation protein [Macrococcus equipercicus]
MERIMIIGPGGAGKSTLARTLGHKLHMPVIHLDAHMWKPNWQLTTRAEQRDIQEVLLDRERWIIDGNYSSTIDVRINKADTIIFLDINRRITIYQAIKRYLTHRNQVRPDMAEGCVEKIDLEFLSWIWNFPRDKRPGIMKMLLSVEPYKNVIILKTPQQIERFVQRLADQ